MAWTDVINKSKCNLCNPAFETQNPKLQLFVFKNSNVLLKMSERGA